MGGMIGLRWGLWGSFFLCVFQKHVAENCCLQIGF